ncbi:MAG: hypothetical protein EOP10_24845 [Proteobacteria bacterium]|nr:MAG: hypothetical protein EOP10_24845 [Pseudomonadota bacterium]
MIADNGESPIELLHRETVASIFLLGRDESDRGMNWEPRINVFANHYWLYIKIDDLQIDDWAWDKTGQAQLAFKSGELKLQIEGKVRVGLNLNGAFKNKHVSVREAELQIIPELASQAIGAHIQTT